MSEAEIKEAVFKILRRIAPEADPRQLAPEENIRERLDIDSFDYLQLMIGLHESLGVEIPEADYPQLATLSGMVRYLSARVA